MIKKAINIVWFKRDLRFFHNEAIFNASQVELELDGKYIDSAGVGRTTSSFLLQLEIESKSNKKNEKGFILILMFGLTN